MTGAVRSSPNSAKPSVEPRLVGGRLNRMLVEWAVRYYGSVRPMGGRDGTRSGRMDLAMAAVRWMGRFFFVVLIGGRPRDARENGLRQW